MIKTLKFLHSLASCGIVGALLGYAIILSYAPQDSPNSFAQMRQTISLLCNYLLLPSLALALVTGLLAMAVHRPFQELRWVWIKAFLGLSMFEGTLAVIQSKADYAAAIAAKIATGEEPATALDSALRSEWVSLGAIVALSIANIVLGVWRPALKLPKSPP